MKKLYLLLIILLPFISAGQTLESINPTVSAQGEAIILSIRGKNTQFKTGTNAVKLTKSNNITNTEIATSVKCIHDSLLQAAFIFKTGTIVGEYDVEVKNSVDSIPYVLEKVFYINTIGAAIQSVTPSKAKQGDTVDIVIKGINTHFKQATSQYVSLGWGISPLSVSVIDDLTMICKFDFNYYCPPGIYDLRIYNSIEVVRSAKAFTLEPGPLPPEIISVTPATANKIDSVWLTIKGKNTFFKKYPPNFCLTKSISSIPLSPLKTESINDTLAEIFYIFTNSTEAGTYDLYCAPDLRMKNAVVLNEPANPPVIASFTPDSSTQGDSVTFLIKGKHTHFTNKADYVYVWLRGAINSIGPKTNPVVLTDSTLQVKFVFSHKDHNRKYALVVQDFWDGDMVATDSFSLMKGTYVPVIKGLQPNNANVGKKVIVTFHCDKNFGVGFALKNVALVKGSKQLTSIYNSFSNDSTVESTFLFPVNTELGIYDAVMTDKYGNKISLNSAFTLNPSLNEAEITSINPASATQFDSIPVIITGKKTMFSNGFKNAYLTPSDGSNFLINLKYPHVSNDSILTGRFELNANYYPADTFDLLVSDVLSGTLTKKKAFVLKRIHLTEPKILDILPKSAAQGETVNILIKTTRNVFTPGGNGIKLRSNKNSQTLQPTAVNLLNDSLVSASFSFVNNVEPGLYTVLVDNKVRLEYHDFELKLPSIQLVQIDPAWASQGDSIKMLITGSKTHFNSSTDSVLLTNNFGGRIKAYFLEVLNDSTARAYFAFKKEHLPGAYHVLYSSGTDKITVILKEAFTVIGKINTSALNTIQPQFGMCYVNNFLENFTIKATGTHFLTEADSVFFIRYSKPSPDVIVYPVKITIIDDTTISVRATFQNFCGRYDVMVTGKENYLLGGKFEVVPPVSVPKVARYDEINVFPNPSDDKITLEVGDDFKEATYALFDMYGKLISSREKIEQSTQIDLSSLPTGMYFLRVVKGNQYKTQKIIKQ